MDRFKVLIEEVVFGGSGMGRVNGKVCFIPGVITGELVSARLVKDKTDYMTAYPLEILEPSPDRVEPLCPLAIQPCPPQARGRVPDYCPGCSYQHMSYSAELATKQRQLETFLERLPDSDEIELLPPFGSPVEYGYRNKITMHAAVGDGATRLGYLGRDNQTVQDTPDCPLAMPQLREKLQEERSNKGFFHSLKDRMKVTFRCDSKQTLMWRGNPPANASWLKEETPFGLFSVPCGSFSQINSAVAQELVNRVAEYIQQVNAENVVDLYCGAGLFACAAAGTGVKKIRGGDLDGPAIKAAEYNLKNTGHPDSAVFAGPSGNMIQDLFEDLNPDETVLVVDPPRTGLDRKTRDITINIGPKHIIYVSCSPDTLGRDLNILIKNGYNLKTAGLLDMFPKTSHFESIIFLEKQ